MPTASLPTLLVIASGLFFALIAIAYKLGANRGVPTLHIAMLAALGGSVFFGVRAGHLLTGGVPAQIWVLGLLTGLAQFACVLLIRYALQRGPLSPMWCATCLGFLPAVLYSMAWLHEPCGALQVLGVLAGVVCVIVSAFEQSGNGTGPAAPPTLTTRLSYGIALGLLLLFNSAPNLGMKFLGTELTRGGPSYMEAYGQVYLCALYLGLVAAVVAYLLIVPGPSVRRRVTLQLGLMATIGSVGGLWCVSYCTGVLPGAVVFTGSSIASILAAALVSVLALGERRTAVWYATVGLALASVVLVNLPTAAV